MKKLYNKSELWFALACVFVYVAGSSAADSLSLALGAEKSVTLLFHGAMSAVLMVFIVKNGLWEYYGLCRAKKPGRRLLYYIPLTILASVNLWFGITPNGSFGEGIAFILSMLPVGFLEELLFRGLLFRAMSRDNVRAAVVVSSLIFGLGHIINLFNGSGMELAANLCQIACAVSVGFLFVELFRRGGSLLPCIITHGVLNALSFFENEAVASSYRLPVAAATIVISLLGCLAVIKTLPIENKE